MRDHIEFLRQYRRHFTSTGSIAPSSGFLARAMTGPLCERNGPRRILEIGPGTGAVTRRIVRLMGPDDRLDLVELNDVFAGILRRRFETDRHYRRVAGRSELHVCPIQEFASEAKYDIVISGLPINNFAIELVRDVFEAYFRLLAPGGVLSYFEYMYMRPMRKLVSGRATRERLNDLDAFLQPLLHQHRIRTSWVFINLPPAWVQHLRPAAVAEPAIG
ncbi:MAG TPA: methyltransferase domain-containing protein [Planctomycetaceae bacterium]|nr:methyltransferase domain-containing protein [Planctomycetaceae bacterium]